MQTKADRDRKKREKEQKAEREAELAITAVECEARADELRPSLNQFVQYYDGGWRVGTLTDVDKHKATIQPMQSRWTTTAPKPVRVLTTDVRLIEQEELNHENQKENPEVSAL